jgi:outer membrane protein assembly factor BamD
MLETYPQAENQNDAVAILAEAYTRLGNKALADDARRVLEKNDPQHPWLRGEWPDYPSRFRRLNPFAGERSALDR